MVTKLFKRTDTRDVFDVVTEPDEATSVEADPGATAAVAGESENTFPAIDLDTSDEHEASGIGDEGADEPTDGAGAEVATTTRKPGRRWVRDLVVALLTLMFVALGGAAGFFGWEYKQQKDIEASSGAALAAAQQFVIALTSIDTNAIDKNFDQVIGGSTGDFKDTYSQSAGQLRQVLIDNKAQSTGTIVDSAVQSATKDKVEVLLFVDQRISNTASPEPREDRSRVAVTMQLVGDRWLASNVELK